MIHSSHGIKIYRHRFHLWLIIIALFVPLALLFWLGRLGTATNIELFTSLALSLSRLILAYAISLIIAVGLAVTIGGTRLGTLLLPLFDLLQNVPSFALIPVFVLLLGYTNTMAVTFAATAIIWPILFYVLNAIHLARAELNEAATIFGATGSKRIWHYLIPLSFPAIITGSLVGISVGWEAIIGIEIIGFPNGIGVFLTRAGENGDTAVLWAGIGFILFLVFVINRAIWTPLLRRAQSYGE